jgi:hypothetical protein
MISIILLGIFGSLLGVAICYMICSLSRTCYELHTKNTERGAKVEASLGTDSGEKHCQQLMDEAQDAEHCESIV